jgi:hypothetical protein
MVGGTARRSRCLKVPMLEYREGLDYVAEPSLKDFLIIYSENEKPKQIASGQVFLNIALERKEK